MTTETRNLVHVVVAAPPWANASTSLSSVVSVLHPADDVLSRCRERWRTARLCESQEAMDQAQRQIASWLCARALLVAVIRKYSDPPLSSTQAVLLERTAYGAVNYRPYAPQHHFSVSHEDCLVAVAVAKEAVGVDIASTDPTLYPLYRLALTAREKATLDAMPDAAAAGCVYPQYWSLKEAVLKCKGWGMASGRCEIYAVDLSVLPPLYHGRPSSLRLSPLMVYLRGEEGKLMRGGSLLCDSLLVSVVVDTVADIYVEWQREGEGEGRPH